MDSPLFFYFGGDRVNKPFQNTLNYYGVSRKYAAKRLGISVHKMSCYCRLGEPLTLYNLSILLDLKSKLEEDLENGEIKKEWEKK